MTKLSLMIAGLLVSAALTLAAGIDGKWSMEGMANKKTGKTAPALTLNLKAAGAKLEGQVEGMGRKGAGVAIQDGKIDGNKFSFTTTVTSKKGDQKVVWEGTVEGDALKGTRMREGGRRGQPFTAKRAS
jgi:hypothetical protein